MEKKIVSRVGTKCITWWQLWHQWGGVVGGIGEFATQLEALPSHMPPPHQKKKNAKNQSFSANFCPPPSTTNRSLPPQCPSKKFWFRHCIVGKKDAKKKNKFADTSKYHLNINFFWLAQNQCFLHIYKVHLALHLIRANTHAHTFYCRSKTWKGGVTQREETCQIQCTPTVKCWR